MEFREMQCPYCDGPMDVAKIACAKCNIAVEGKFNLPRVALLPPDEAAFLAEFVLAGFSIKEFEKRAGMSYPAIRARLDKIIHSMNSLSRKSQKRKAILDRVERGEISSSDAIKLIENL
jgi:hypothetical protein